jgi:hypothetical protein
MAEDKPGTPTLPEETTPTGPVVRETWHKPEVHEIHYAEAKLGGQGGMRASAAQLLSATAALAGQGNMSPPDEDEKKFWGLRPRKHSLTDDTNKGGAPNYGPFVRDLALRFLKAGNYPDREEDFAEELARWFTSHDHSFNKDPKASTIQEHIRDLWRQRHQWPQRREGIPLS